MFKVCFGSAVLPAYCLEVCFLVAPELHIQLLGYTFPDVIISGVFDLDSNKQ